VAGRSVLLLCSGTATDEDSRWDGDPMGVSQGRTMKDYASFRGNFSYVIDIEMGRILAASDVGGEEVRTKRRFYFE